MTKHSKTAKQVRFAPRVFMRNYEIEADHQMLPTKIYLDLFKKEARRRICITPEV